MSGFRICFMALSVLLLLQSKPVAAAPLENIVIFDIEIGGDLSDQSHAGEWEARTARLTAALRRDVVAQGLYRVADMAPAAAILAGFQARRQAYSCVSCLLDVTQKLEAGRMLVVSVFRMSNLILSIELQIRDGKDGALLHKRHYSFRGDNDLAWEKAEAFLIRDLAKIPPEQR